MRKKQSKPASTLMPPSTIQKVLEGFNQKVDKLERGRFYQSLKDEPPTIMFKFDNLSEIDAVPSALEDGTPTMNVNFRGYARAWVEGFDEEAIHAFTLTYRVLTQNNDSYSVSKLAEIYQNQLQGEDLIEALTDVRNHLATELSCLTRMVFADQQVTIAELVDTVIYGELAHSTPKKEAQFRSWTANPTSAAGVWIEFISAMRMMMRCFLRIRDINTVALQRYFP